MGRLVGLPIGLELVGRAVAGIGEVAGEQVGGGDGVSLEALHLAIRPERPAILAARRVRTLVPLDPEPVETLEDVLLEGDGAPGDVRVLEAEDERAAGRAAQTGS